MPDSPARIWQNCGSNAKRFALNFLKNKLSLSLPTLSISYSSQTATPFRRAVILRTRTLPRLFGLRTVFYKSSCALGLGIFPSAQSPGRPAVWHNETMSCAGFRTVWSGKEPCFGALQRRYLTVCTVHRALRDSLRTVFSALRAHRA